ncbi:MAG: HAD family hydrolase, partial [Patescibacteria group bacterium]
KQHFAIGLLSNGNSHPKRLSLEGMFQFVVFSQDQDVEKPDKRIFKITADQAGCSLAELIHVGDSLPEDYQGAKQAGCQGIWLNRGGKMPTPDIPSRDEISSLSELPALVEISKP